MSDERYTFTQARVRLEEIVAQVRKKDTSLERSLELLEEGVRLANVCTELSDHTEWRNVIEEREGGEPASVGIVGTDGGAGAEEAGDAAGTEDAAEAVEDGDPPAGFADGPEAEADADAEAAEEDEAAEEGAEAEAPLGGDDEPPSGG